MDLRMPSLSGGEGEAVITAWHAREGARITKDQDLFEVATDKATFDVPSPCDGRLEGIIKKEGSRVIRGEVIARVAADRLT